MCRVGVGVLDKKEIRQGWGELGGGGRGGA